MYIYIYYTQTSYLRYIHGIHPNWYTQLRFPRDHSLFAQGLQEKEKDALDKLTRRYPTVQLGMVAKSCMLGWNLVNKTGGHISTGAGCSSASTVGMVSTNGWNSRIAIQRSWGQYTHHGRANLTVCDRKLPIYFHGFTYRMICNAMLVHRRVSEIAKDFCYPLVN